MQILNHKLKSIVTDCCCCYWSYSCSLSLWWSNKPHQPYIRVIRVYHHNHNVWVFAYSNDLFVAIETKVTTCQTNQGRIYFRCNYEWPIRITSSTGPEHPTTPTEITNRLILRSLRPHELKESFWLTKN